MSETGNKPMSTPEDQARRIGEICGELWVRTYASRLEQNHLLAFVPEDVNQWNQWLQQPSQYTVTQRFFFVLAGDDNFDCAEAQAFWQRYCEWASVDQICFCGFALKAAETTADLQCSYSGAAGAGGNLETDNDIEKARLCAESWEAGAHWAKHFFRPEQLNALRVMTGNRRLPWRQWLQSFSTYTVPERIYFVIAADASKNRRLSSSFWNNYCPAIVEYEACAIKFVCGAINIEKPSLVRIKPFEQARTLK